MVVLGLCFCTRAFSSCSKRGPLFIAARRPLTIAASLVAEHRLQTRRLGSCGSRAQLLRGMWDLPRPGLEPVSPALAGRFSTTAPPGKPDFCYFKPPSLWSLGTASPGQSYVSQLCVCVCVCVQAHCFSSVISKRPKHTPRQPQALEARASRPGLQTAVPERSPPR